MKKYKLEITKWGIIATLTGRICKYDLKEWYSEVDHIVEKIPKNFQVLLDLVDSDIICEDTAKTIALTRAFLIGRGMERSVIVYDSSAKIIELNKALIQSGGLNNNSRYISIYTHANYLKPAIAWLTKGIEP